MSSSVRNKENEPSQTALQTKILQARTAIDNYRDYKNHSEVSF